MFGVSFFISPSFQLSFYQGNQSLEFGKLALCLSSHLTEDELLLPKIRADNLSCPAPEHLR